MQEIIRDVLSRYGLYVQTDHWGDKPDISDFHRLSQSEEIDDISYEIWNKVRDQLTDDLGDKD